MFRILPGVRIALRPQTLATCPNASRGEGVSGRNVPGRPAPSVTVGGPKAEGGCFQRRKQLWC